MLHHNNNYNNKVDSISRERSPRSITTKPCAPAFREVQEQHHLLLNVKNHPNSRSTSNTTSCTSLTFRYDNIDSGSHEQLIREGNHSFIYLCEPILPLALPLSPREPTPETAVPAAAAAAAPPLTPTMAVVPQPEITMDQLELRLLDVRQRKQQLQQLATQVVQRTKQRSDVPMLDNPLDELQQQQQQYPELGSLLVDSGLPAMMEEEDEDESMAQHRNEVEIVCQNIPTLQREIRLLQQLGEQLEVTLRANLVSSSASTESSTGYHTPRSGYISMPLPIVHIGWLRVDHVCCASQCGQLQQRLRCIGCVQEFRIETKTLTELKTGDESQYFYLPLAEGGGLARTSFRQLRETPSVLLRQLRPLSPKLPFNLLEQDAMFFNSMLSSTDLQLPPRLEEESVEQLLPRESGGGAAATSASDVVNASQSQSKVSNFLLRLPCLKDVIVDSLSTEGHGAVHATVQCELPVELPRENLPSSPSKLRLRSHSQTTLRWKRPKLNPGMGLLRQQRSSPVTTRPVAPVKPLPLEIETQVQTQLLKTVLVGVVQVAVFLVLIMAFTYPDVRC